MSDRVKETIRIVHLPSRTPITELKIEPDATVAELQAMVHAHMASEEDNLVRVLVQRWFREVVVGDSKRRVELDESDLQSTLSSLGITDYTTVFVEGPLMNTVDGVGRALEAMYRERIAERRQQQEMFQALTTALNSLTAEVQQLKQHALNRGHFQIFINIIAARKILTLDVEAHETIRSVKDKIHAKESSFPKIDWSISSFTYNGKVLEDDRILVEYDIQNDATLDLLIRLPGGIQYYFETPKGKTELLGFSGNSSIKQVLDTIQKTMDISPNEMRQLRLKYNGKQLEDYRRIPDFGIPHGATIHLVHW